MSDLINRGRTSPAFANLDHYGAAICTSVVVFSEIRYGVAKKGSRSLAERADAVLRTILLCPFEAPTEWHYADIRVSLERQGPPIGPNDLFIAAQCRALGLCLVTADVGEFSRVGELLVGNWLNLADEAKPH